MNKRKENRQNISLHYEEKIMSSHGEDKPNLISDETV